MDALMSAAETGQANAIFALCQQRKIIDTNQVQKLFFSLVCVTATQELFFCVHLAFYIEVPLGKWSATGGWSLVQTLRLPVHLYGL